MSESPIVLKYVPFISCVDASFWHKLAQLKLDVDRLEENVHNVWGYYSNVDRRGLNRILSVDCSSFNKNPEEGSLSAVGRILNKNTVEGFRQEAKNDFLLNECKHLLDVVKAEEALDCPESACAFSILCFADLKKHKFSYWFAFPALSTISACLIGEAQSVKDCFTSLQLENLSAVTRTLKFGVVKVTEKNCEFYNVRDGFKNMSDGDGKYYLIFGDSCGERNNPGWPLRNFLSLFAFHCSHLLSKPIKVICLRLHVDKIGWSAANSLVLNLKIDVAPDSWNNVEPIGWERNDNGKLLPRIADLHLAMDPISLAETSVDLNLKLMKWQVVPDLDLSIVQSTKCLLLGAGTLGCAVARSLLAWGVRHITFVDNATVSYSNPVRQSLFQFSDVGKAKAGAAALALKNIFPAVISEGLTMSIPMPGHPVGPSLMEETRLCVSQLEDLIRKHDVVFLLMDSRESRWLPTVMAAALNKLVINAALGFDSYLVMRHGLKSPESYDPIVVANKSIPGTHLGCYFCSDVTAPGNSGQARTLDQQCTVTRPGVSNIAGSLAVELLVSILQHDQRGAAPAYAIDRDESDCILGLIPHSIRGFLSRFQTLLPAVEAFSSCVGCSLKVTEEYKKRGFEFVLQVLDSKEYLEELTGLSFLHSESLLADLVELESAESGDED